MSIVLQTNRTRMQEAPYSTLPVIPELVTVEKSARIIGFNEKDNQRQNISNTQCQGLVKIQNKIKDSPYSNSINFNFLREQPKRHQSNKRNDKRSLGKS